MAIAVIAGVLLLGQMTVVGAIWRLWTDSGRVKPPAGAEYGELWARVQHQAVELAEIKVRVDGLPGLWEEAADRASRAAERSRKAKSRARSSEGEGELELLETDAEPVRLADGSGSAHGRLPAMRQDLVNDAEARLSAARAAVAQATMLKRFQ